MPVVELTVEQLERIPRIIEEYVPQEWLMIEVSLMCKAEEALDGFQTQMFRRGGIEYKHVCDLPTCEIESSTDHLAAVYPSCGGLVTQSIPASIST